MNETYEIFLNYLPKAYKSNWQYKEFAYKLGLLEDEYSIEEINSLLTDWFKYKNVKPKLYSYELFKNGRYSFEYTYNPDDPKNLPF